MADTHLRFISRIGSQKPESIINRQTVCPFCDRAQLDEIIDEDGTILLVKNKYPVLEDAYQTVVIETNDCDGELSVYDRSHLHRLFRFGFRHWLEMQASARYASVLFFKNHGPLSGGTIHHPHMQIVGLNRVDYRTTLQTLYFEGIPVTRTASAALNVSTQPRVGFFEFNVLLDHLAELDTMADYVQAAVHYTLNHLSRSCNSYNLFFYELPDGRFACKVTPRFVTSPLYIGYAIPQVSDRVEEVAADLQRRYFAHCKPTPSSTHPSGDGRP
ncbi:MAG: DUF4931 domain-containing protein [Alicyclobacillus sp.]|nr:DUF4931 domain-containing protein [Alicyclobacillus sp.]